MLVPVFAAPDCEKVDCTTFGVSPVCAIELIEFIRDECPRLRFCGLMSVGGVGDRDEFENM